MEKAMVHKGKKQEIWTFVILLVIGTASFIYWGGKKQIWFCDEIYTYESSNGFEQDWPAATTGQWMTGEDVEAFFSADSDNLSLNDITVRLYSDHVPLYFWLFRMVSFLFKGSGTIWIGLSINLVFYLIILGVGYRIVLYLTESPFASGVVMLLTCVTNRLAIEQATTLRMYIMLLWAEFLLLLGGLWILRDVGSGDDPWVFVYLFVVSVTGFLTHYDFWIFYAADAACFCLYLLARACRQGGMTTKKGWKSVWRSRELWYVVAWLGNFILSIFVTTLIFPYCKWNLNRDKGQMALRSVFVFSADKISHILWGYKRLSASIFGEKVPAALGLAVIFGCVIGGALVLYRKRETEKLAGMILVALTAQAYMLVVCFTLPDAEEERYLWGAFTFMTLCMAYGGILLFRELFQRIKNWRTRAISRGITAVVLVIGILAGEFMVIDGGNGVAYLFQQEKDVSLLGEHGDIPWIVYGPTVGVYSYYDWIIPEQICFLTRENTLEDAAAVGELKDVDRFVLYIYADYLPDALDFFGRELGRELAARELTKSTNLTVYVVE